MPYERDKEREAYNLASFSVESYKIVYDYKIENGIVDQSIINSIENENQKIILHRKLQDDWFFDVYIPDECDWYKVELIEMSDG